MKRGILFAFLVVYIGRMTSFVFSETLPNSKTIVNVALATYSVGGPHPPDNSSKTKESNKVYTTVDLTIPNIIYPGENSKIPTTFVLMGLAEENSKVEVIFESEDTPSKKKENKNTAFKIKADSNSIGYYCVEIKDIPPSFYNVKVVNREKKGKPKIEVKVTIEVKDTFPSGYPKILDISYLDSGRKLNIIGTSSPNSYLIAYNYNTTETASLVEIVGVGTSDKKGKFNIVLNGQIPPGNNMLFVADTTDNIASEGKHLKPQQGPPPNEGDIYIYNYPNPLTGTTIFKYYLPETSDITLEIFNTAGRRLTYFNTRGIGKNDDAGDGSGWNEYPSQGWDGKTREGIYLSNGVYIYRLTAIFGGRPASKTNKLLILR